MFKQFKSGIFLVFLCSLLVDNSSQDTTDSLSTELTSESTESTTDSLTSITDSTVIQVTSSISEPESTVTRPEVSTSMGTTLEQVMSSTLQTHSDVEGESTANPDGDITTTDLMEVTTDLDSTSFESTIVTDTATTLETTEPNTNITSSMNTTTTTITTTSTAATTTSKNSCNDLRILREYLLVWSATLIIKFVLL